MMAERLEKAMGVSQLILIKSLFDQEFWPLKLWQVLEPTESPSLLVVGGFWRDTVFR